MTILFMNGRNLGLEVMARTMGYENRLFDNTRVHSIDIVMNEWDELIANATSEEYYAANVVIDGEVYQNVGIRGKGNTSLSTVSSLGSERYSFKLEFDQYDSTKSYYGLDKLSLNNLIQDTTMMKDYLTYTMMGEFGVAAPLCSFVYITVNGEDWGLYLAVEGVEESFLERNYGSDYGELYKPDSMSFGGGRGNGKDFNMQDFDLADGNVDKSDIPENFDPSVAPAGRDGGRGGFNFGDSGRGASDVKLQYIDDDPDSYSNIWDNAKTDISKTDQKRLIESLKKLSGYEDLETVVDIEQVIRYFVVHNFVCNGDSYTGSMIHNYYLYEEDGKLAMIPWDYNLAFGTFQAGDGQNTVNTPIDSPVSGGSGDDRPMWNWILSDETYTDLYHQLFTEFLNTVDIQSIIDNAYNLIGSYVKKDPTAFYTYEEFETGVETIRQFCAMRSESATMQLANGETTSNKSYVDASELVLSDMGSMGGMGDRNGMGGGMPNPDRKSDDSLRKEGAFPSANTTPGDNITVEAPEGFEPPQAPEGNEWSQAPGDFESPRMPGGMNGQISGGEYRFNKAGMENATSDSKGWIWLVLSVLILGAGLAVVKSYLGPIAGGK